MVVVLSDLFVFSHAALNLLPTVFSIDLIKADLHFDPFNTDCGRDIANISAHKRWNYWQLPPEKLSCDKSHQMYINPYGFVYVK